jgi:hypothetical protein
MKFKKGDIVVQESKKVLEKFGISYSVPLGNDECEVLGMEECHNKRYPFFNACYQCKYPLFAKVSKVGSPYGKRYCYLRFRHKRNWVEI